ncbi:putative low molecular weight protein-tyrosine-phosphatase [Nymphon striatum]|nr:putative low molecular weight protein-tyrosine-phosphatase [Nymphon striatum]
MTDVDDRLIGAASPAAKRVELHTHLENDGVMKMIHVEEGFAVAAGEMIDMERGGKHVMLMGLNGSLEQGAMVAVTLTFEKAGDIEVMVPVDLERKPEHGIVGAKAKDAGLELTIDSAGTGGWHIGDPPDARAIVAARLKGYDISGQISRRFTEADFETSDLIVAMDETNRQDIEAQRPSGVDDTCGADVFVLVLEMVQQKCRTLISRASSIQS